MTQLTENVFAVEVPDKYAQLCIDDVFNELYWWSYGGVETVIPLPPGSWQFICTTKECTEEQAKVVVLKMDMGFKDVFVNYVTGSFDYDTAVESLNSLLASKGLDSNKNYCLLKKVG